MKVKELIEELSKLDQDKQIWGVYDCFDLFDFIPNDEADEYDVARFGHRGMEVGDYIVNAW